MAEVRGCDARLRLDVRRLEPLGSEHSRRGHDLRDVLLVVPALKVLIVAGVAAPGEEQVTAVPVRATLELRRMERSAHGLEDQRLERPIHEIGDNHLAGDQEPLDLFAEERRVAFDVVEGQVSVVEAIDARQRLRVGDDEPLRASHAGRAEDLRDVLAVVPGVERRPLAGKRRERNEEMTVVRSRTHVPHLSLERLWVLKVPRKSGPSLVPRRCTWSRGPDARRGDATRATSWS